MQWTTAIADGETVVITKTDGKKVGTKGTTKLVGAQIIGVTTFLVLEKNSKSVLLHADRVDTIEKYDAEAKPVKRAAPKKSK
jgi:hypothetical protein